MSDTLLYRRKLARNLACRACGEYRMCPLWDWAECETCGKQLNDAFMGGPKTNCPNGLWNSVSALTQKQVDAQLAVKRQRYAVKFIKAFGPLLLQATDVDKALDDMVLVEDSKFNEQMRDAVIAELERA